MSTMEDVQRDILAQADKLTQTNQAFETVEEGIGRSVEGIGGIIQEMSLLNDEKNNAVTEVQNVSALAQENAASIEETAAAIDNVSDMAGRMDGLLQVADALNEKASIFRIVQE